ncbi:MAG TPA: hypothetical protein VHU80_09495 [Polyangiaceae bacterium]|nr:hypothetical protein [Polyangiaceae bacterium]
MSSASWRARSLRGVLGLLTILTGVVASVACGDSRPPPYWYYGPCDHDLDCPVQTYCMEPGPGSCLVQCRSVLDCAPGYLCGQQDRRGAKGKLTVCLPPPLPPPPP